MRRNILSLFCLFCAAHLAFGDERLKRPIIKDIEPSVFYPAETTNGMVDLRILGENFGTTADEIVVRFSKYGKLNTVTDRATMDTNNVLLELVDDSQINLFNLRPLKSYPRVSVQVGRRTDATVIWSEPLTFLVSKVDKVTPAFVAAGISLLLLALPLLLLMWGKSDRPYRVADEEYNVLSALFLDPETDTFSLSKFQFYAWTAAGIFGYVYLTVARSLVQGVFEFADIPQNLPGIILISATTTVAAQGVTSTRGPKGAGAVHPSFADFVTTGGVVAPERFQFFVWTCLGVVAFIFMIVMHDPSAITDLPKIPKDFLYLMGLSSFGYVGGKMARQPGPIIDDIRATFASLVLEIQGRNLSKDASFEIDGEPVTLEMIRGQASDDSFASTSTSGPGLRIIEPEAKSAKDGLAKTLEVIIAKPKNDWFLKKSQLTIINPDGQKAAWSFEYKGKFSLEVILPTDPEEREELKTFLQNSRPVIQPARNQRPNVFEFDHSDMAKVAEIRKRLEAARAVTKLEPIN